MKKLGVSSICLLEALNERCLRSRETDAAKEICQWPLVPIRDETSLKCKDPLEKAGNVAKSVLVGWQDLPVGGSPAIVWLVITVPARLQCICPVGMGMGREEDTEALHAEDRFEDLGGEIDPAHLVRVS